jgi:lipid-binding SYLF domain-containing protein
MRIRRTLFAASLLLAVTGSSLWGRDHELATVQSAVALVQSLPTDPHRCLPPAMLHEARAVVVIPHVVKAGLVIDRRYGHGVMLVRRPDGTWSEPLFVTLEGGGVGLEAGVEETDLVLLFRTEASVDHILKGRGKLTLGADVAVAVGPLGREAEASTALLRRAEIYSYARSRGLFAGLSLEGDHLLVNGPANEAFYHVCGCRPADVLARHGAPICVEVDHLREHFVRLASPPAPSPAAVIHR